MGLVFGKVTVETPKYTVLADGQDYEIREYGASIVAEVSYDPSKSSGGGFMVLADYIGALGKPCNIKAGEEEQQKAEKIAMTAPVLTQDVAGAEKIAMTAPVLTKEAKPEKIAMTAPVLTKEGEPEKIAASVLTEVRPTEEGGEEVKSKRMMVMQFVLPSKYSSLEGVPRPTDPRVRVKEVAARKFGVIKFSGIADDKLVDKKLGRLKHALQEAGYKVTGDHTLAQYNPPWTIPFLRTNELMLPVE